MTESPQTTGLGTLLRHLVEQLDGDVESVYGELGLNCRSRFTPVIRYLDQHGPSSIRTIANNSGVSHSAISQTVTEMTKRGLVESNPGEDGRERIISFTSAGDKLLPDLRKVWKAIWAASDNLSSEIGMSLPLLLGKAVVAVEDRSFKDRILEQLQPTKKRRATRC